VKSIFAELHSVFLPDVENQIEKEQTLSTIIDNARTQAFEQKTCAFLLQDFPELNVRIGLFEYSKCFKCVCAGCCNNTSYETWDKVCFELL